MPKTFLFFFALLILINYQVASASSTMTVQVYGGEEIGFEDDEIVLDNNETLDVSDFVETVPETVETVGGVEVALTQKVTMDSVGDIITLTNTALPTIEVEIPRLTVISANATWDKIIIPPKSVATIPIQVSGFITPTTSILIGSPTVVLVFDRAVTIVLTGVTGQTAYKIPGGTEWILISTCSGTFDNPGLPAVNGECSISNDVDTKIRTYHFTEFAGLTVPTPTVSTPETTTSSGGHGNTGVGSPRAFGSGSSGSSTYYTPGDSSPRVFPAWFDNVKDWYREGKISATEYLNAYQWIIENI